MSRWVGMVAPVCLLAGMSTTFAQSNDFRTLSVVQGAMAQAGTRAAPQSRSAPIYTVGGLRLGSRVQVDSSDYREYKCSPSEQVAGFTWCQKTRQERDQRGSSNVTYSILHSQDETVVYVNRFQEPALFAPNDADVAIRRYSTNLGEKAQIKRLPPRPGVPAGTLATWGKVSLEILDSESISMLAEGKSPKKGYLIDFIGNFARSAKEGLPVYRISGGAGFVWAASTDPRGRGTLRFAAIDPSAMSATPVQTEARTSETQENLLGAEQTAPARPNAGADVFPHDVALQEAESVQKAQAEAVAARNESEAASRDAQLAKDELERLRTEKIALNTALERSEAERTAAEGKAHTIESVAYGTIIILVALLAIASWLLLANRRKAKAANHEAGEPETKPTQVVERSPETGRAAGDDLQPWHTSDMSPERAQSSTSDAATTETREDGKSTPKPDAAEERMMLPM